MEVTSWGCLQSPQETSSRDLRQEGAGSGSRDSVLPALCRTGLGCKLGTVHRGAGGTGKGKLWQGARMCRFPAGRDALTSGC